MLFTSKMLGLELIKAAYSRQNINIATLRGRINKEVEKVDLTSTVWEVDSLLEVNAVYIVEVNSDKCQLLRQSTL